jgi:hypothetical protein
LLKTVTTSNEAAAASTQPTPETTTPELAQLREQLAQQPNSPNQKKSGTSPLQMQIGLFRLIQEQPTAVFVRVSPPTTKLICG